MTFKKTLFPLFFLFTIFFSCGFSSQANATSALPDKPIKILLVPGHDNEVWGAQYGNTREADMNLVLATRIYNLLKTDKRFEVYITRDSMGYTTEFADYFASHQADILSFEKDSKKKLQVKIDNGTFVKKTDVRHNKASEDMVIRLYGVNKWANDNKIDMVLHVHFNDYPRKNKWIKGAYKGFTIYVPEGQMINSKESLNLAKNIFSELSKKYAPSNYKKELGGITPDQSLIALGSNGTLSESVRSILIEYGYIYRFGNSLMRHQAYVNMADLTFSGVKNYFFGK
jgi:N-acetylmuramoyl-L-alanine amidase